jgi:outer membrane lipoprotein SlyB
MKRLFVCATMLAIAASSPVYAKGCIKGAIVGGLAGSAVGHGKLGAVAGCVVGHHEANKPDARAAAPAPSQPNR